MKQTDKWMNELVKNYRLPKEVEKKKEPKTMLTEEQRKIIEGKK